MPKVRSVFLSDIHLGTRACQADRLLDFLREHPAEQTYLVGDIIDFWAMSRSISWSQAQNTVVQKLLRRARHGERVVFIPGKHDEALRIPVKLDSDSMPSWTRIPEQAGQSERSDAGFSGFTLLMS